MKTIINALREVYGLFVEDASYTVALLIWLLLVAFVLPHFLGPKFLAPILFAGLALILLENVARSARKR
jgi:hypothetical protein